MGNAVKIEVILVFAEFLLEAVYLKTRMLQCYKTYNDDGNLPTFEIIFYSIIFNKYSYNFSFCDEKYILIFCTHTLYMDLFYKSFGSTFFIDQAQVQKYD